MTSRPRNDATTGVDSLGRAVHQNLSAVQIASIFSRGWNTLRRRGWQALLREVDFRFRLATHQEVWRRWADIPLGRDLKIQRKTAFGTMPLLSLVAPLYNTSPKYLRQMVNSVRRQSYGKWELLLVDASDAAHISSSNIAKAFAQKDKRIRYIRLAENRGIAENTNAGLRRCEGDWVILLDHDDTLSPAALFEVAKTVNETGAELIYSDEIVLDETLRHLHAYHFKPDFGPDTLRGCNYITHLCAFSYHLLESVGGQEQPEYDGAQDYDLILRLSEKANKVVHIPKVLYTWRQHSASTASDITQKPEAVNAGVRSIDGHLERVNLEGRAEALSGHPGAYRVRYSVWGQPLVSVLIPSCDHAEDLRLCLDSLYEKAGADIEVLVLDNNSKDPATEAFYVEAEERYPGLSVLRYPGAFNFAAICNFGAKRAKGEHILLLNNDIEILSEGFVSEMLAYSQRPDVGAVGAMLYYADDTVQHAGLFVGIGGTAGVSHKGHPRGNGGDMFRLATTQNVSAVTGAALMVERALYEKLGGMDEHRFPVVFNDVDFCLRLREQGFWNVFTPFAEAYHFQSKTINHNITAKDKLRYDGEAAAFQDRYADLLRRGDPFYNRHLTLKHENYGLR